MKKMRLESMEHLVGIVPEAELVKRCFEEIDKARDSVNELLKDSGRLVELTNVLILNDKEYPRPVE